MKPADLPAVEAPAVCAGGVFVYVLLSAAGAFYVGSASDVSRRVQQHGAGRGAKFTLDHGAGRLVYVEGPFDLKVAVRREFQLKRWSRAKKEALIRGEFESLKRLGRSRN